jgi:hypothetical protein
MAITRPVNIDTPWADQGLKATIPNTSQIGVSDGRASYPDGFPPLTMTQIPAGGVPFFGQDMNGILNALSAHTAFQNSGGQYRFDPVLVANIGGYPVGTVLQDDNGIHSYRNILANNSINFNTTPAAIGVSWMPYSASQAATETLAGIAELATQAEVNAGDSSRIVTASKIKSGHTISLTGQGAGNQGGHFELPIMFGSSGATLLINWGSQTLAAAGNTTVTFHKAFSNVCAGVVHSASPTSGTPAAWRTGIVHGTDQLTSFIARGFDSTGAQGEVIMRYHAFGW